MENITVSLYKSPINFIIVSAIENKKKELEIENYAISQLSLEQLFLKFAKLQAEEEEEG